MKKVRILALVLAVLMVAVLFAGCGKKPDDTSASSTSESTTSATTTEPTTTALDFSGYEFTWINGGYSDNLGLYFPNPANANQQSVKDVCDELCSTYNFSFTNLDGVGIGSVTEVLMTNGLSGTKVCDFAYSEQDSWGTAAMNDYLRRLDTEEVVATGMNVLDPAQFDEYTTAACKLGGEVYVTKITGEGVAAQLGHFLAFNKALLTSAGYSAEQLYQAVRDYEWTWDVLIDISHAGAKKNEETQLWDVCGLSKVFGQNMVNTMCKGVVYYNGSKYVSGLTDISFKSAMNLTIERLIMDGDVMQCKDGVVGNGLGNSAARRTFYDGKSIFGVFDGLDGVNAEATFAYGVVPMPRGSAMSDYVITMLYAAGYGCQAANADWEKSCAIFGLLGSAMNDTDAGIALNEAYCRDAESLEMLRDYIFPKCICELSVANLGTKDAWGVFFGDAMNMGVQAAVEKHAAAFQAAVDNAWKLFNK